MKKILIILSSIAIFVSCSSVTKHNIAEEQVNRLIASKLNTVAKLGPIDVVIKHINTKIENSRLYSDISLELKGLVSTAPTIFNVSYSIYFKNGKLKIYDPRVENITDSAGNKLKADSPLVKEPLNILIKYLSEKEISDFQNFNIPFDKLIQNIKLEGNKLGLYLK